MNKLYSFLIIIIIINNRFFIQPDTLTHCVNRSSFFQINYINRKSITDISEEKNPTVLVCFHCKKQMVLFRNLKFALNFGFVQTFN